MNRKRKPQLGKGSAVILAALMLSVGCGDDPSPPPGPESLCSDAAELEKVTEGSNPTISPDGKWMAFVSDAGSVDHIVKMNLCDGTIDTISSRIGGRFDLGWSPVDDLILFRADSVDEMQGGLWTIHPETGEITEIPVDNMDDGPAWSPTGDAIVYQCSGGGACIVTYPGGVSSTVPCSLPDDGGDCAGEEPAWSADGQWIAFEGGTGIMKVDRTGGDAQVVVEGLGDVSDPAWSPDGKWIAFTREDAGFFNRYHIWVADARGSAYGVVQITVADPRCTDAGCYDDDPCWSPDSRAIYFERSIGQEFGPGIDEIWRVNFDGI